MFASGLQAAAVQALAMEQLLSAQAAAQQATLAAGAIAASGSQFAGSVPGPLFGSPDTFSGSTVSGMPHADDHFAMKNSDTAGRPLFEFLKSGMTTHPLARTAPGVSFATPVALVTGLVRPVLSALSLLERL